MFAALDPGAPLALVTRADAVESVHTGHLLITDAAGGEVLRIGSDVTFFPRSALKPWQAVAMLRAGADLSGAGLALAAASHSGTPAHVAAVRALLGEVPEALLANTPDYPLGEAAREAVLRAGGHPERITQNCSGKHAGMLRAALAAGWDTAGYLDPGHPLQRAAFDEVAAATGAAPAHTAVDGCGAPAFSTTMTGLARALRTLVTAAPGTPERAVADAMRAYPEQVAGEGRLDTRAMRAVPGLFVKGGYEGVLTAALPDGAAIVVKVADGNARALPVILAAALRVLGVEGDWAWGEVAMLGGGRPEGAILPAFGERAPVLA